MKALINLTAKFSGLILALIALTNCLVVPVSTSDVGTPTFDLMTISKSAPVVFGQSLASDSSAVEHKNNGQTQIIEAYGKLPLSFEANHGQANSQVKFLSCGHGSSTFLFTAQTVLLLNNSGTRTVGKRFLEANKLTGPQPGNQLQMRFVGGNPRAQVIGLSPFQSKSNYLIGSDPGNWHTNIANYAKIKYESIYPGIDLVFYGNHGQLEYDLNVSPRVDPEHIRLKFDGVKNLFVNAEGELVLQSGAGEIRQSEPTVYQDTPNGTKNIASRYILRSNFEVGFQLGPYDRSKPLIIDPVLSYSTYLGGSGMEQAFSIAVNALGEAYITGFTKSANFPAVGSIQPSFGGGPADAFVVKLNSTGNAVVYSTYLGGSGNDSGNGIAVDSEGNAYVTGFTDSMNFPTTTGAFQSKQNSGLDLFITKLNDTGTGLIYSTYLGGSGDDENGAIAVDSAGNAYVSGDTTSTDFPTPNALQADNKGQRDVFVAKFTPNGSLLFSTYIGGSKGDKSGGITVDSSNAIYITGATQSPDFPTTEGAFDTSFGGGDCIGLLCGDAFVTKLNDIGTRIVYSTYLGGDGADGALGIAVNQSGNIYVTGTTDSPNFPVNPLAFQKQFRGGDGSGGDAFVTEFNNEGSALIYSTYIGGRGADLPFGIAVDSFGNAHITGITDSVDFPLRCGLRDTYAGGFSDAFVTKLNALGSSLIYSSFLGGNDFEIGVGIAVDSAGNAYVAGFTLSPNFPIVNPVQPDLDGTLSDVFITKLTPAFSDGDCPQTSPTLTSLLLSKKGKRVDHLVVRAKTKKYLLFVFGSGFSIATTLTINSTPVQIISVDNEGLMVKLPPGRVNDASEWAVQAHNPGEQSSNILFIEIRNE